MRIAETMHRNYYNTPDEEEDLQASQRLRESGYDIEKQMLITLANVKSLYDIGCYRDCFEMLQSEYLRNSSYTSLLYLYGKYIIKSNNAVLLGSLQQPILGSTRIHTHPADRPSIAANPGKVSSHARSEALQRPAKRAKVQ